MLKELFGQAEGIWKRSVDRGAALTALIIVLPMIVMIALLILITMGRPIFSRDRCIGFNGAVYTRWRFRTAKSAPCKTLGEAASRPITTPRIPRLGIMLRESGLDDLPQLFNIFCGHASFVGLKSPKRSFFCRAQSAHQDLGDGRVSSSERHPPPCR
jgi:lipopolysaccharide/colanic/teichoic acid biosynthesis glycosyltransferase